MWNHRLIVVLCALSLPACAGGLRSEASGEIGGHSPWLYAGDVTRLTPRLLLADEGGDMASPEEPPVDMLARPPVPAANLPKQELTRDILYKLLLAEIAGQRGNVRLSARAYLDIAQSTRDPRLARRATELAMVGRFNDLALEAAALWLDVEPESVAARQTVVAALINGNKINDAKPYLRKLIAAEKTNAGLAFMQLYPLLSRAPDKVVVYNVVRDLAADYPKLPEAHFAVAQAALSAGKPEAAGQAVKQSLALKPDWEPGALLNAQILQRQSNAKALEYLQAFLATNPGARDVRLAYARALVAEKQLEPARQEFRRIEQDAPNNPDVAVTLGLLSFQLGDLETARSKFQRALELNYRDVDAVRYYLGQVAEERKQPDEALKWYAQVEAGEQLVPAAARYAFILVRQDKLAEARAHLQQVDARSVQQRVQLTQAEAQVLREAKAYQDSFDLLGNALERTPDHPDLLYDYAMAAERLDRLDVVETKLKRLIQLKPDHAQAYNALGYTFADRNIRLKEAREYIEQALKLSPDDPFILDSMGWVQYRLGNLEQGLVYLKRAYQQRPDAEIAAHLGEVLWAQGRKTEAEGVWRASLQTHPGNEELLAVIRKFSP